MPPSIAAGGRTRARARSKPAMRRTTARHSAMSVYEETMKLSASCTWPNAVAVCTRPPSGISPRKYRGAVTTNGKMTAACAYPAVSHVRRFCRRMIDHQLPTTAPNR